MQMERLLNVEEVAHRLGVKQSTIRRMILERKIGYVKLGRRFGYLTKWWIKESLRDGEGR